MAKIFKTQRCIYRVEQNENGTLDIYRECSLNMGFWHKDGRRFANAGSLIVSAGGIEELLSRCEDIEDVDGMIEQLNNAKEELHRKANDERLRQQAAVEDDYHRLFDGVDVVTTKAETVYVLLRYLNAKNWGTWQLPKMTIGYQCNQYDCDGKIATTIKLDHPISVNGKKGTMFVYGAPSRHLTEYERITDWE